MTTNETEAVLKEIVDWAKNNISAAKLEYDFSKNFVKTTKQHLSQYVLNLALSHEQQRLDLSEKEQGLSSLEKKLAQQKRESKDLKRQIEKYTQTVEALQGDLNAGARKLDDTKQKFANQLEKIDDLKKDLDAFKKKNKKSEKALQAQSEEFGAVQIENNKLLQQVEKLQKKLAKLTNKAKKEKTDKQVNQSDLEAEVDRLSEENQQLLAKVAQNSDKVGEHLGDYEKRENYQVAKDYEEFCLYQGVDYLTEEIVTKLNKDDEEFDDEQHRQKMLETKQLLIRHLLIDAYDMQVRKLRLNKKSIDFTTYKKKNLKVLLKTLKLSAHLEQDLVTIAQKGFDLINELLSLKPPCQLLLAEPGTVFNADEHDVDPMYSQPGGVVKFTLVPGIYAAHEILMKPVVVTESDEVKPKVKKKAGTKKK